MTIDPKETKRICDSATAGPWTVDIETEGDEIVGESPIQCTVHGLNRSFWCEDWADVSQWKQSCADAEFAAHAREALPLYAEWVEKAIPYIQFCIEECQREIDRDGWNDCLANQKAAAEQLLSQVENES